MHDVIIIGSGPGGSAAAAELGRRGFDTLLLDKSDFPRDKTCGDALTPRAVRTLAEMGVLDALAEAPRITEAVVVAPDGRSEKADLRDGQSQGNELRIVPRLILDETLRAHAVDSGAQFASPVHVRQLDHHAGHVEVRGERQGREVSFCGRAAIVATGASSGLLTQMGLLAGRPRMGLAVRVYFESMAGLDPNQIQFRFDGVPLPGYAWIFPISMTSANVGLGVFGASAVRRWGGAGLAPRAVFESWLQTPALRRQLSQARPAGPIKGYPIRSDFLQARTWDERVLVVGEAAGLVNPLTGDGIDFALESGRLAAQHLAAMLEAGDFSPRALGAYHRQLRKRYAGLFGFCLGLQRFALGHAHALNLLARLAPHYPFFQRRLIAALLGRGHSQPAPQAA